MSGFPAVAVDRLMANVISPEIQGRGRRAGWIFQRLTAGG